MEESYDILISVLEASVKKNGEKPLTNKYLLNILKKVRNQIERFEEYDKQSLDPNWD